MKKWKIEGTRGASTTEYLVLLAGMGVLAVGAVFGLGVDVRDTFSGQDSQISSAVATAQDRAEPGRDGLASTPAEEPEPGNPVIVVFTGTTAKFDARLEPGVYTTSAALGSVEDIDTLDDAYDRHRMGVEAPAVAQVPVEIKPDAFVRIDWGPGAQNCPQTLAANALSTTYQCSYSHSGPHTVRIDPAINRMSHFDGSLLRVESWGDAPMQSLMRAFGDATNLESLPAVLPPTITNLSYSFTRHPKVPTVVDGWNVSRVRNFAAMFGGTTFNRPLAQWDVGNARDLSMMFSMSSFNQPIGDWNTSKVELMNDMFGASPFNQPIGNWDTGKVKDMTNMFGGNTAFNQPIGNWNTSNVESMSWMFAEGIFNQPIGNWNTSKVEDMSYMFYNNRRFNQDITRWDVRNLVDGESMFNYATAFNRDIGRTWQVPRLAYMYVMFRYASALETDFTSWRPAPIHRDEMKQVFQEARKVRGNLRCWDVSRLGSGQPDKFYTATETNATTFLPPKWGQQPDTTCTAP